MVKKTNAPSSILDMLDFVSGWFFSLTTFVVFVIWPIVVVTEVLAGFILPPQNYNINIQHDLTTWLVAMIFPTGSLICVYFVSARISAQWEKRYPSENFDEIPKRKIDTLYHFMIIPAVISWSTFNYTFDILWIFAFMILGIFLLKIHAQTIPLTAHPQYAIPSGILLIVSVGILIFTWFLSLEIIHYYSSYIFIALLGLGALAAIWNYKEFYDKDLKIIKNLRLAIESEEDMTAFLSYIQRHISDPPTPLFYPAGLNFLTHTNSEYPWENQSNPDSILALIYSHKNKIFLTDVLIGALIIAYPPALVWVLYLICVEPTHLRRTMSANMRLKYDQLIERCGGFCDIEYGDSVEYSIKSITPKFANIGALKFLRDAPQSEGWSNFGYPERAAGANLFRRYEIIQRQVEELEMIRDKGIMYTPDSAMTRLVNELGLTDRLSRHINKLELDYLPRKTDVHSVKPSNDEKAPLEERLYEQISELKIRLERHENILNRLVDEGRWRYVYSEKRTKSALNDIRTCTERLLYSRCESLGKEMREHKRTLDSLIGWLRSDKVADLDRTGAKHASVIKEFVNPASHHMTASDDDYLKALDSFVQLVEWHVENPPQSRGT